jgi:guanosine-3',5'-bis(diphosphate) 3'-pyrophosphohydrolase
MTDKSVEISKRQHMSGPVCKSNLPHELDNLLENILSQQPEGVDFDLVVRAYFFADKAHSGQIRRSGDPYVSHPVEVANILADMKADDMMIAAALLHDVIEDTDVSHEEIAKEFSEEIAVLVDGVTKLSRMSFTSYEERKAENARKMIFAISKDVRVILIKLADRLHNLKTLQYLPEDKQKRIAQDTLDFYAPLAHRLGIYQMRNEMEDLAFKYLMPDVYLDIAHKVSLRRAERERAVQEIIAELSKILAAVQIKATVQGRAKHLYSIYKKMEREKLDFEQILDLTAFRVIVSDLRDCYTAVGVIHAVWKPMYERFKDYIGRPKANMYQSLHTVVIGPQGKPIEIQIRTEEMHRIAEYGVSAHWLYKEGKDKPTAFDQQLAYFRQVVDWQSGMDSAEEFMETLKLDLLHDEVLVFTPKGDVITLPIGATTIDFAYQIHTEVGNQCRGAKVNGQIVALESELKSGDIVEIITQNGATPSLDWLNFVVSSTAKSRIKQFHRKLKLEDSIDSGKMLLDRYEHQEGLQALELLTEQNIKSKLPLFNVKDLNGFYAAVGRGELNSKVVITSLKEQLIKTLKSKQSQARPLELIEKIPLEGDSSEMGVDVKGMEKVYTHLAKCCLPIYGDRIVGYITQKQTVSIHRQACKQVQSKSFDEERKVEVNWIPGFESKYLSSIDVWVLDRVGVLNDITKAISETKVSVSDLKMQLARDKTVRMRLRVQVKGKRSLERIMNLIQKIPDVLEVSRSVRM